jgi:hypothetical protein
MPSVHGGRCYRNRSSRVAAKKITRVVAQTAFEQPRDETNISKYQFIIGYWPLGFFRRQRDTFVAIEA